MADLRGQRVEKYKLTPQMKAFLRLVRKEKQKQDLVKGYAMKTLLTMKEIFNGMSQRMMALHSIAPKNPTMELQGMEFGEEEETQPQPQGDMFSNVP